MTDKELRTLNRRELLELLVRQEKENTRLKNALTAANEEAEMRQISIDRAGSIAEASLQLTNVFEEAEKAAQIYLENVKRSCADQNAAYDRIVGQARAEADRIIAEAEAEKRKIIREADDYWQSVSGKMEAFYQAHIGLRDILSVNTRSPYENVYTPEREAVQENYADVRSTFTAVRNSAPESRAEDRDHQYTGRHAESGRGRSGGGDSSRFSPAKRSPVRKKASPDDYMQADDDYFFDAFSPLSGGRSGADTGAAY